MEFNNDTVTLHHEIDQNPKPEDAGRIKVYGCIILFEILDQITDFPTVLLFSLPSKDFSDNMVSYSWEQLTNSLKDEQCLNSYQIDCARNKLSPYVSALNYSPDCALSMHITFISRVPTVMSRIPTFDDNDFSWFGSTSEEEWEEEWVEPILEENRQVPFGDIIQFRPASKFVVESLSRKVYKNTATSSFDMCTICLDAFKMGERVMTLPCGHEFDDSCILEWFATNHVCPLSRFELPCES